MRYIVTQIIIMLALLLASCAQQPTRPTPAPVEDRSTPTPAPTPPPLALKPKPKPKPALPPKTETQESETAPAPLESIESSKVGYYFDTLQGRLRQLAAPDVVVNRQDNHITLDVTRRIAFGNDDAPTTANRCAALAPIAKALVEYRMTRLAVAVSAATNDDADRQTAKSRSESIARCFANAGIAAQRIAANGVAGAEQTPTVTLRIDPIVRAQ